MGLRCATLLLTVFLLASLTGCGDARIGLCSGGAEFCDDFLRDTFNDRDEEPPTDDDLPTTETAFGVITEAVAVATATPHAVGLAVSHQSMNELARDDPDLVGLWLTAATLGRLSAPDNVSISEFLDLNRAWLSEATATGHSATLDAGLTLFAAFSRHRDPALAVIAENLQSPKSPKPNAGPPAAGANHPAAQAKDIIAHASDLLGRYQADHCCQAEQLAAAAVVLCDDAHWDREMYPSAKAACSASNSWMADDLGLSTP